MRCEMTRNNKISESPKSDLRDTEAQEITEVDEGRPGNPDARDQCRLGNFYFNSVIYEYAVNAYKQAIRFDPNYAMAYHNLGVAYYKLGLFAEAITELMNAINLRSDVARFHYMLGIVLKDDKKLSEAITSFSNAVSLDAGYVSAYYDRGFAYFYNSDLEKACFDLEKVTKLQPGFRDTLYNLGVTYTSLGRWEDARAAFIRHLELKPNDPDAFYHIGLTYIAGQVDSKQAMENFQRAVDLDSGHLKAMFQLSLLHARQRYRDSSHRKEAIANLRNLIEMYQEIGSFERIHEAFFILGSIYDDDPGDADLAIEAYKNGLQLAEWSAEVHNNLGVLYSQKGAVDEAVKEFRAAIRIDPEYENAYRNLAKLYFYQRNEEIMKDFQRWIQEMPEVSARILFNLSLALIDIGRAEACESIYSRAHRIKNLIGVAGSKLRRACREVSDDSSARLTEILTDQEKCYNEMVSLLGALKHDDLILDMVNVNAIIEGVIRQTGFRSDKPGDGMLLLGDVKSSNIECFLHLAKNLPNVKGDPMKLKEALNNIIINALEAMNDGGTLTISTQYSDTTSEVEITLQDNGVGISAEDLDNIFKPGYTTKEAGSGFGLSIVDRIIKEHKGRIHISSRKGERTEVKIHLPVNLELAPIQTSLRMRPVIYEDPGELIFTEVDRMVSI